jgi:hypothetical protein
LQDAFTPDAGTSGFSSLGTNISLNLGDKVGASGAVASG